MPSQPCRDHTVARQETTSAGGEEVPWQSLTIARESVPDVRDQIIGYLLTHPLLTRCGGFAWRPLRRYRRAPRATMHERSANVNTINTKPSEGSLGGLYARREPVEVATTVKIPFRACSTGNLPTRCRSVNTISGPRTNSRVALIRLNNRAR